MCLDWPLPSIHVSISSGRGCRWMPFTVPAFPPKIFLKMNSLFDVVNSFAYENG